MRFQTRPFTFFASLAALSYSWFCHGLGCIFAFCLCFSFGVVGCDLQFRLHFVSFHCFHFWFYSLPLNSRHNLCAQLSFRWCNSWIILHCNKRAYSGKHKYGCVWELPSSSSFFMKMHPVIHAAFLCLNHCNRFSHHPFPLNPQPCSSHSPKERACFRSCKSTALSRLQSLLLSSENSSEEDGESITLDSEEAIQPSSPSVVSILLRAISYVEVYSEEWCSSYYGPFYSLLLYHLHKFVLGQFRVFRLHTAAKPVVVSPNSSWLSCVCSLVLLRNLDNPLQLLSNSIGMHAQRVHLFLGLLCEPSGANGPSKPSTTPTHIWGKQGHSGGGQFCKVAKILGDLAFFRIFVLSLSLLHLV